MASKTISQLDAKTPTPTDIIPVADPVTGIAGKSDLPTAVNGGDSLSINSVLFTPEPSDVTMTPQGGVANYEYSGAFFTRKSYFTSDFSSVASRRSFNYASFRDFSESSTTSLTINSKYLDIAESGFIGADSSVWNLPSLQTINAPELIGGGVSFQTLSFLTSVNFPKFERGKFILVSPISLAGSFSLPAFKFARRLEVSGRFLLSSMSFPELVYCDQMNIGGGSLAANPNLTSVSFPKLKYGTISISAGALANVDFPELEYATDFFANNLFAQTISAPKLKVIVGNLFSASSNPNLTSFSLPSLRMFQGGFVSGTLSAPLLTQINLPELVYAGNPTKTASGSYPVTPVYSMGSGTIQISSASLTTLSMPKLQFMRGMNTTATPALSTFTMSATPKIVVDNFILTNAALSQASVDGILASLAYLDGTANAPYPAYSSKTINLSGGTSATPSAAGLASKAILVARGCTVTHN